MITKLAFQIYRPMACVRPGALCLCTCSWAGKDNANYSGKPKNQNQPNLAVRSGEGAVPYDHTCPRSEADEVAHPGVRVPGIPPVRPFAPAHEVGTGYTRWWASPIYTLPFSGILCRIRATLHLPMRPLQLHYLPQV